MSMLSGVRHDVTLRGVAGDPRPTAYWEYGDPDGVPLLLVHGFRGDHHGLEGIAKAITGARVIVPDLPGFGESERLPIEHDLAGYSLWLREFQREVLPGPFALLGHSFGSLVVSRAVSDGLAPQTLTLVNPISAPALEGPRGVLTKLAIFYYKAGAKLPAPVADQLLRNPIIVRVMSEAMAKTRDRALRAWIHDQHARYFSTYTDRDSLLESFTASVSNTVTSMSAAFTMPTQIIAGEIDDITPLEEQLRLANSVGAREFHVIARSGHLVHYEATQETADLVSRFVAGEAA